MNTENQTQESVSFDTPVPGHREHQIHSTDSQRSNRDRYIKLRKGTSLQILFFCTSLIVASAVFFLYIGIPLSEKLFLDSFGAKVEKYGEHLNPLTSWKVIVEPPKKGGIEGGDEETKVYLYDPLTSLLPLIITFGIATASLLSTIVPASIGLVQQKIHREIINTLHKYASLEYGDHSDTEVVQIANMLRSADYRQLHDMEERWQIRYVDIEIMQKALRWEESGFFGKIIRTPVAVKLYMRNYFTMRYENLVMGSIYIGAAVLIIVIGLRGLQFIPKNRPSLVLFAIMLEFILLIVYAVTLIYTKHSEEEELSESHGANVSSLFSVKPTGSSAQAERLLKMFVAQRRL